jgi:hypothetical protein
LLHEYQQEGFPDFWRARNNFLDGNVPTHLRDKTAQHRFVLTLTHYLWLNGLYGLLHKAIGQAKTPSEAAAAARKTLTIACQVLLPGLGYLMLHLLQPSERAIDYLTGLVAAQPVRNWLRTVLEREATNVVEGLFQHLPAAITLLAPQPDDPEFLLVLKKLPSRAHEMLLDDLGLELDHRRRYERKRGQPISQQMDLEHVNIADAQDPSEEFTLRETTRQMLAHAKSSLTDFQFSVLELYILKGQPVQQVARALASTPNSVQKTASIVRKKLNGQIHF